MCKTVAQQNYENRIGKNAGGEKTQTGITKKKKTNEASKVRIHKHNANYLFSGKPDAEGSITGKNGSLDPQTICMNCR